MLDVPFTLGGHDRPGWTRPDPPVFLWSRLAEIPPWVRLEADPEACETFFRRFFGNFDDMKAFRRLAMQHFSRLAT